MAAIGAAEPRRAPPGASMIQIRRYPNRRFYDRTRRRYVTLGDIEQLVRDGGTVEVHDSRNGDDLTRQVLAQILLERHPDKMELFPTDLLHALLQANDFALGFWGVYLRQALETLDSLQRGAAGALPMAMPFWPLAFFPPTAPAEPIGAHLARLDQRIGRLEGTDEGPASPAVEDDADLLARLEERVRGLEEHPRPGPSSS